MIDPHTAGSALGLLDSTIKAAKSAVDLAKSKKDTDVRDALNGLLDRFLDLQMSILQLDEENKQLKAEASNTSRFHRAAETGYFYRDGDESPFCPACFEGEKKQIHLSPPQQ